MLSLLYCDVRTNRQFKGHDTQIYIYLTLFGLSYILQRTEMDRKLIVTNMYITLPFKAYVCVNEQRQVGGGFNPLPPPTIFIENLFILPADGRKFLSPN